MAENEIVEFENKAEEDVVSIVIVSYNDLDLLRELIPLIEKQTYKHIEVICVINGTDKKVNEYLLKKQVIVIDPKANLWYSGGNNLGVSKSRGEYIFILNSDTRLEKDTIANLVLCGKSYKEASVIVPKVLSYTGKIDSVGKRFIALGWDMRIGAGEEDHGQYDDYHEVPCFDGVAFLIRRKVIEEVGLFDTRYKFFKETLDLSCRLLNKGHKSITCPNAIVYHKRGGTFQQYQENPTILYFKHRNDFFVMAKHYNVVYLIFVFPIHILYGIWSMFRLMIKGKIKGAQGVSKGMVEGIRFFLGNLQSGLTLSKQLHMIKPPMIIQKSS